METLRPLELLANCAGSITVAGFLSYHLSVLCGVCNDMMQLALNHLLLYATTIPTLVCQVGLWENH